MSSDFSKKQKSPKISDIVAPDKREERVIKLEPKESEDKGPDFREKLEGLTGKKIPDENLEESPEGEFFALKKGRRAKKETDFPGKIFRIIPKIKFDFSVFAAVPTKIFNLFSAGRKFRLKLSFIILFFLGIGFLSFFILPRAEVRITPKSELLNFDIQVFALKNLGSLDLNDNKIPAEVLTQNKETQKTFPSSGRKMVERKAEGIITVYNSYSSSLQTLVRNTRFISDGGKLFRTIDTVTIPGATIEEGRIIPSQFDVKVVADEPGDEYNIGPATFSIPGFHGTPKYVAFYGKSKEKMTGGFRGEVSAVTQEDIDSALKQMSGEIKETVEKELGAKIPSNLKLIEGAQETRVTEIKKPEIGEERDNFSVSVRAISRAIVFSQDHIVKLVNQKLEDGLLPEGKEVVSGSLQITYSLNKFPDFDEGILDIKVGTGLRVFWKIDEKFFKDNLAGKDKQGIKDFLSGNQFIERAQVSLWPFWVKRAPKNPEKIKIKVLIPQS